MSRPKLQPELEPSDKIWEIIAFAGLLALVFYPIPYFSEMPERIPTHFNAAGEPDSYGGKGFVWLMPAIGFVLYAGLTLICRYPHTFNYAKEITPENAEPEYRMATRLMRMVKAVSLVAFAYINFAVVQTGLGKMQGLGPFFLPVFLVLTFAPIGWYWWKSSKKRKADGS